jgi:protein-disulfide isomerase
VPPRRREEPRRRPRSSLVLAIGAAACIAAALIAVSFLGARETATEAAPRVVAPAGRDPLFRGIPQDGLALVAPAGRDPLFRGIPQDGLALGRRDAPLTLVEYADLQCPYCAQWAREALPAIVTDYVRTGRVRLVFRGLAFLGPDSDKALRAALAAGERDRLWDAVHALYERQGHENAGWVTDDLLRSLAAVGVVPDRMSSPWVERQRTAAAKLAQAAGVPGTPYFEVGRTGGPLRPLQVPALDAASFTSELDRLLAA